MFAEWISEWKYTLFGSHKWYLRGMHFLISGSSQKVLSLRILLPLSASGSVWLSTTLPLRVTSLENMSLLCSGLSVGGGAPSSTAFTLVGTSASWWVLNAQCTHLRLFFIHGNWSCKPYTPDWVEISDVYLLGALQDVCFPGEWFYLCGGHAQAPDRNLSVHFEELIEGETIRTLSGFLKITTFYNFEIVHNS